MELKNIETQIAGCEAAIKSCKEGIEINTVVLEAFKKQLEKCQKKK